MEEMRDPFGGENCSQQGACFFGEDQADAKGCCWLERK
jgi:hypothetical protein